MECFSSGECRNWHVDPKPLKPANYDLSMSKKTAFRAASYVEPNQPVGRVLELFAGVGGFRIGLSRAGLATVASNQYEPGEKAQYASRCYEANFKAGEHYNMLIEDLITSAETGAIVLPKNVDVLVGGFPCQDYSVAKSLSTSTGIEGKKGVLWWQILRLMDFYKEENQKTFPFVFLENVDRLLKSPVAQRGRDFAVMVQELMNRGYAVEWRVVSASDYGFPQRRIRVFILAKYIAKDDLISESFAADQITRDGILAKSFPSTPTEGFEMQEVKLFKTTLQTSETFGVGRKSSPFANAGFAAAGRVWTQKVTAQYSGRMYTLADVLEAESDVPDSFIVSDEDFVQKWKPLKDGGSYQRKDKATGFEYLYSEGKMTCPDDLQKPARTILTAEGGTSASRFKHIIRIGNRYRRLMPLELERLSGFPDNHTSKLSNGDETSDIKRAFFLGNALVVGLVERVGHEIAKALAEKSTLRSE